MMVGFFLLPVLQVIPRRFDWQGRAHAQTYEEWVSHGASFALWSSVPLPILSCKHTLLSRSFGSVISVAKLNSSDLLSSCLADTNELAVTVAAPVLKRDKSIVQRSFRSLTISLHYSMSGSFPVLESRTVERHLLSGFGGK
jgi:hypothetical protein